MDKVYLSFKIVLFIYILTLFVSIITGFIIKFIHKILKEKT
jgi:hypothetical protein